jgi:predicted GIY-YIG superfamily endonuclease
MCKLHNLKDATFIVYHLQNENYVGVTHNLHKRLLKHKNKSNFDISNVEILLETKDLQAALKCEMLYQELYKCIKGVRNQNGNKNPYAKQVLHLQTGVFFDTIKDACDALGFSYSAARHQVLKQPNKYNLIKVN